MAKVGRPQLKRSKRKEEDGYCRKCGKVGFRGLNNCYQHWLSDIYYRSIRQLKEKPEYKVSEFIEWGKDNRPEQSNRIPRIKKKDEDLPLTIDNIKWSNGEVTKTHVCPRCGEEYPRTDKYFWRRSGKYSKYFESYCKKCHSQMRWENMKAAALRRKGLLD